MSVKGHLIQRKETRQMRPNGCGSMKFPPSSVTATIMRNADKIKQTLQYSTVVTAMRVIPGVNF